MIILHCDYCCHEVEEVIMIKSNERNINTYCKKCAKSVVKEIAKQPWMKDKKLYNVSENYFEFR